MSDIIVYECPTCGVRHGIPAVLDAEGKANRGPNGRRFHCPNGHQWWFIGKSEADKLREQLEREQAEKKRRVEQLENELYWSKQATKHVEARRRAAKGVITKMRKKGTPQ